MNIVLLLLSFISSIYIIHYFLKKKKTPKSICSICGELYKEKKLTLIKTLAICPNDLKTYQQTDWIEIETFKSNPHEPEESMLVYRIKKKLEERKIPSFIETRYSEDNGIIYSTFILKISLNDKKEYLKIRN